MSTRKTKRRMTGAGINTIPIRTEILTRQIKKLREEKGWTYKYMAKRLGIDVRTLKSYEEDSSKMRVDDLIRYTQIFQVSLEFLVEGTEISDEKLYQKLSKLSPKQKRAIMAVIDSY